MPGKCIARGKTRNLLIFIATIVIGLILNGCSDAKPKVYRVGILCGIKGLIPTVEGFKARMTELGYLEGRNIRYDLQKTIDAILLISEPLTKIPAVFSKLGKFADDHGIPIGGAMASANGHSAVFGLTTGHKEIGRLAAQQVHKALKGVPVGTIPVVSAESYFEFNYKAAQQLGLNVPEWLLRQADEIIR